MLEREAIEKEKGKGSCSCSKNSRHKTNFGQGRGGKAQGTSPQRPSKGFPSSRGSKSEDYYNIFQSSCYQRKQLICTWLGSGGQSGLQKRMKIVDLILVKRLRYQTISWGRRMTVIGKIFNRLVYRCNYANTSIN